MPPTLASLRPPHLKVYDRGSGVKGHPIPALMQQHPLLISDLLTYAGKFHPNVEIVSRLPELPVTAPPHRSNFATLNDRSQQLANALVKLGVQMGDRVATLSHNHTRHLECYYGISGIGAILHTINPRLFVEQIEWIINHAEDTIIFVDFACLPLLSNIVQRGHIHCKRFVLMVDELRMPHDSHISGLMCYETLLQAERPHFVWPSFDENSASAMCYTSGTTSMPKGVLYSHRSTILHTLAMASRDYCDLHAAEVLMPIVPMFHVLAWSSCYAALMTGSKLVFTAQYMDAESVCRLMNDEKVTQSFGVPTVWFNLMQYIEANPNKQPKSLRRLIIGGATPPRSLLERIKSRGIIPINAYGMTESSPLVSLSYFLPKHDNWSEEQKTDLAMKQGRPGLLASMTVLDENGQVMDQLDESRRGDLALRGNFVTSGYFKRGKDGKDAERWEDQHNLNDKGWFITGDVSTIDQDGYMQIVDRALDRIKSGGEWVDSPELENAAHAHPDILEAAAIGRPHSKWTERPLVVAVKKPGSTLTERELTEFMATKVARHAIPEAVEFVDSLPHTATGKLLKRQLREDYKDYVFPSDRKLKSKL